MNILFFHNNAISKNRGGISRITSIISDYLSSTANNVHFLSKKPYYTHTVTYPSLQLYLPNPKLFSEENIDFVEEIINTLHIDILINQAVLDINTVKFWSYIQKSARIKIVSCIHNSLLTPTYNYAYQKEFIWRKSYKSVLFGLAKRKFFRRFSRYFYAYLKRNWARYLELNSDAIVFVCTGMKEEFNQILGYSSEKAIVIPNCIPQINKGHTNDENWVLWVGTIDFEVKRIQTILGIWKRIQINASDWKLLILGDGKDMEQSRHIAKSLKLNNVIFEGRVDPTEYYQKAKILCVTSTHESFSLVTVEAQSFGVVPVVNNSFPAAELLIKDNYNGILVKAFNDNEFADKLLKLMNSPTEVSRLSGNATITAKDFTLDTVGPLWLNLITSVNEKK